MDNSRNRLMASALLLGLVVLAGVLLTSAALAPTEIAHAAPVPPGTPAPAGQSAPAQQEGCPCSQPPAGCTAWVGCTLNGNGTLRVVCRCDAWDQPPTQPPQPTNPPHNTPNRPPTQPPPGTVPGTTPIPVTQPPQPTQPPRPTNPPPTATPYGTMPWYQSPTPRPPCNDTYDIGVACQIYNCGDPNQAHDVLYRFDCTTNVLLGMDLGPCHACQATATPTVGTPTPTAQPPPTVEIPTPCPPEWGGNGVDMHCPNVQLSVASTCPQAVTTREPYPRGLVTVPNVIEITGPQEGGYAQSESVRWGERYTYTVYLKWVRIYNPPAKWSFQERSWNIQAGFPAGIYYGERAEHAYETSSFGLPVNGPGVDCDSCLPAYQVQLDTNWKCEIRATWYTHSINRELHCVPNCNADLVKVYSDSCASCGQNPQGTPLPNAYWERVDVWIWHDTGWHTLDLTKLGNDTWYFTRHKVIPVPVIEVQSVITTGR
ncbi:MAG: hypothetical protein KKA73_13990 [Chloroflexi bacterium]|nr:hypothetical protein [Chloroflexota bacterium]